MSSPFKTSQEFLEAKGPLYTFASSPVWLGVFLILSVLIFLWFIYASYRTKGNEKHTPNPTVLSLLIITSVLSLSESVRLNTSKVKNQSARNTAARVIKAQSAWLPVLGITVAGVTRRRSHSKRRRPKNSGNRSRF